MSGVWKQARAQEKAMLDNLRQQQKRAERRAAYFASKVSDPLEALFLVGIKAKFVKDDAQYNQIERNDPLVAWNGRPDVTIDRFDVRSLLDMIPDSRLPALPVTEEEAELEEQLNFERYHLVLRNSATRVTEAEAIAAVRAKESRAMASMRLAPTEIELAGSAATREPAESQREPRTAGEYSAVGFSYGGGGGGADDSEGDSDSTSSSSEEEKVPERPDPNASVRSGKEVSREEREAMAKQEAAFGVRSFLQRYDRMVEEDRAEEERKRRAKLAAEKEARGEKLSKKERRRLRDMERVRTGFYEKAQRRSQKQAKDKSKRKKGSVKSDAADAVAADAPAKIEFITEFSAAPGSDGSAVFEPPEEDEDRPVSVPKVAPIQDMRMEPIIVTTQAERIHLIHSIDREFNHKRQTHLLTGASADERPVPERARASVLPPLAAKAASTTPVKETAAEKLKRLMREKLNATQKKDSADTERKRDEAERERLMRLDDLKVQRLRAKSPPPRDRDRERDRDSDWDRSRSQRQSRSRSRSRSRSPPSQRH